MAPQASWPRDMPADNLGICKSGRSGNPENLKRNLKIKICSATNVGKVRISRKKLLAPFVAISSNFSVGRKKSELAYFPRIFLGGPMAAIHPVWIKIRVRKELKSGTWF